MVYKYSTCVFFVSSLPRNHQAARFLLVQICTVRNKLISFHQKTIRQYVSPKNEIDRSILVYVYLLSILLLIQVLLILSFSFRRLFPPRELHVAFCLRVPVKNKQNLARMTTQSSGNKRAYCEEKIVQCGKKIVFRYFLR